MRPRSPDALPVPGSAPRVVHQGADLVIVDKPAGWSMDALAPLAAGRPAIDALDVDASGLVAFGRGAAESDWVVVLDTPHGPRPERTARRPDRRKLARRGTPVRGDGRHGDPLDRRAPRALIHRARLRVGPIEASAPPPGDFAPYTGGDARAALRQDPHTTCFREQHRPEGRAAQVDRYGDWLWVQSDDEALPADLPDARGVYHVVGRRDRSRGGQPPPVLARGTAAPRPLAVEEHGVTYLVELGEQLSTGLFLDQRPQRAWLAQHAGGMRVLNTFAHAGAFSVAAATAGAETVSVDLSRTWLARVPTQLAANGVDPARHDTIYGDVFDWIRRLAKRGERFDLIVLDPPSTSVGKRKKRWSAARDYGELVGLAAPLIAPGGELWTITNHQKTTAAQFAGRVAAALPPHVALARVCPPAVDCPTIGPAPVKTLVWKDLR